MAPAGRSESASGGLPPADRAATADAPASAGQLASNVAGFGENLLNMAELQARMSAIELRQNVEALRIVAADRLDRRHLGARRIADRPGWHRRALGHGSSGFNVAQLSSPWA